MAWIKAFHIIAMVAWFAGLFYLPRLFVYHAQANDATSIARFKIMERRLYYFIMLPAALITVLLGVWLITYSPAYYLHARWMQAKLFCVLLLIIFHVYCGKVCRDFKHDKNKRSSLFYRFFNEFPTLMLITIILVAEIRPF
ncbi:protoporphyrinogen oxidase HemJ [Rickettsiella endosymbiont of Dermanyssus gallinae]|uniref:protoporphyrinogen oxidase HemJ n=1 Tax=Rickettsiella endosymbiont of Dermanyssus gallinae TaxID=2856608 RepID=UPI001C52C639|nr:protoporphyrinogen oxidase HemJ [Rickettsiella endosymbiont of Dermanyssus gallinae]